MKTAEKMAREKDSTSIVPELKFKKFGGDVIDDYISYVKNYALANPDISIAVGCDSQQLRRSTCYAIAIVMYKPQQKNGAHVIFLREYVKKIRSPRNPEVKKNDIEKGGTVPFNEYREVHPRLYGEIDRALKYATELHDGLVGSYVRTDLEEVEILYFDKLVDVHLDLNPDPGFGRNKSHALHAVGKGMLESHGFRTFTKPAAYAATCCADLLCK